MDYISIKDQILSLNKSRIIPKSIARRVGVDISRVYRVIKGYESVSKKVLKRMLGNPDCCTKCGIKKGSDRRTIELHIHHIDKNPKNNKIENLIVLCPPCHFEAHGKKSRL